MVIVADQLSKTWVLEAPGMGRAYPLLGDLVVIRPTLNPGGIFGLFPGAGWLFLVLTAVVVVFLAVWAWRQDALLAIFGLVLGGGVGNLLDRIFRGPRLFTGRVVDFIELPYWPTFNLADSAISVGVLILLVRSVVRREDEPVAGRE